MKHVLNSNQGTMSAVIVRMDGSGVLHIYVIVKLYALTLTQRNYW